jgi:hypothetical protein
MLMHWTAAAKREWILGILLQHKAEAATGTADAAAAAAAEAAAAAAAPDAVAVGW